uniref:hypothetical protein n=1 Tax=Ningiella ruwaisensis TaxID=2364274 RepID=UPI0010A0069A|nr:hypothetical protein [Ningiella ruwaisensis]
MSLYSFALETTTISVAITSSSDDVEESNGTLDFTSSDLELSFEGNSQQTIGLRFKNVKVPRNALIENAYIQFTIDEVSTGSASLNVEIEDSSDALPFSSASLLSDRDKVNAYVGRWMVAHRLEKYRPVFKQSAYPRP